tara:strand:- start:265 stop:2319 length:2055 start_codon:yes stop_codon:yes gene_type:complete
MAENNLRVNILANIKGFEQQMMKAQSRLKSFGESTARVGKSLSIGLTAPITIAGTVAVNQAVRFEKLRTTLNVLTGSADEGAKAFERLVQFSATTPFQLPDLVAVNNTLMGFGLSANDAFVNLQRLGDIAGITGGDLNNIAIAFGQAAAEGRVMTRDLRQFINNGVPVIKILAEEMGVAEGEIMDLASQGQITFDILEKAFTKATEAGGTFAGGTEVLSQTLGGLLSTLKDNVNIALAEFGQAIAEAFNLSENIPKISAFLKDLTDRFRDLSPATQKTIILFTAAVAGIGPLLIIIGKLSIGLGAVLSILPKVRIAFVALTTAMKANPFILVATAIVGVVTALQRMKRATDAQKLEAFGEDLKKLTLDEAEQKLKKLNKTFDANKKILDENNKLGFARRKFLLEDANGVQRKTNEIKKENEEAEAQIELLKEFIKLKKEEKTVVEEPPASSTGGTGGGDTTRRPTVASVFSGETSGLTTLTNPLEALTANVLDSKSKLAPAVDEMRLKMLKLKETAEMVGVEAANAFGQMGADFVQSLGLADRGFEGFVKNLAGTITKLISMLLANAIANSIAGATASGTATGPAAIFTTPAFIATAVSGVMAAFAAIPKFALGGLVSAPTIGMVGEGIGTSRSNPEVIAPLNKLQNLINTGTQRVEVGGKFSINGQDLVLVLQRANSERTRLL